MHRLVPFAILASALFMPQVAFADVFGNYTNLVLQKVPQAKGAKRVKKLTTELLIDNSGLLPGTSGAFVVVRTNEGRWCKLLVQPARQKISATESLPILLVEHFVTYRDGEDRAIQAKGKNVLLFKDFLLNLDLGQIVPATVGGDIRFIVADKKSYAEPVGKAEIYVLTKPLPEAKPAKTTKVVIRDPFVPKYFNGVYQLYDDGRRSGELHLKVRNKNVVEGYFYSDKDGRKYEVSGNVGDPHHNIKFKILFPRTVQFFRGWMFTGNGKAITGYARMEQRETGFYALRKKGKKK